MEVPSRSRLILLSANGSSTLFAGISEGEIGKCLISRLLIVDGLYFPSAPAAFISGLLVTEVLSLAELFCYFCSAIWIFGQAELVSWIEWVKGATVPNQGINLVTSIKHDERIHGRQTVDHNVHSLFLCRRGCYLASHFCVWAMSCRKCRPKFANKFLTIFSSRTDRMDTHVQLGDGEDKV